MSDTQKGSRPDSGSASLPGALHGIDEAAHQMIYASVTNMPHVFADGEVSRITANVTNALSSQRADLRAAEVLPSSVSEADVEALAPIVAVIADVMGKELRDSMHRVNGAVLDSMRRVQLARTTPVSRRDSDFLRDHAGLDDPSILDDWSAEKEDQRRSEIVVASAVQFVADTLSREEAGELLDVDDTNVSRRAKKGQLYAIYRDGRPRYPRWQFRDGTALPGLAPIVACLERLELDPVSVATFMVRPNDELDDHSPVDYLAAGGEPGAVVALLDAWARS
ncbi:hypothetical protein G6027_13560 [Dietzia sp. SLG310A2-38A2]|uniref:hypothetical protein n=1 Tax=Dietzia sp. SLG310A2-38A2 TaxID=1630643 RepID=UPI0015FD1680|nr:hypothetical protein [Dietzia sp. SLG310A2-38A2]MBB1031891.1 hypothetical protein [Dietzia sp. SLG310A2-38A2]